MHPFKPFALLALLIPLIAHAGYSFRVPVLGLQTPATAATAATMTLAPGSLPDAVVGVPYSFDLASFLTLGGTQPGGSSVQWSVATLPGGLSLSSSTMSGTPTVGGTYAVSASAVNGALSASQSYNLSVLDEVTLTFPTTPSSATRGYTRTANNLYSHTSIYLARYDLAGNLLNKIPGVNVADVGRNDSSYTYTAHALAATDSKLYQLVTIGAGGGASSGNLYLIERDLDTLARTKYFVLATNVSITSIPMGQMETHNGEVFVTFGGSNLYNIKPDTLGSGATTPFCTLSTGTSRVGLHVDDAGFVYFGLNNQVQRTAVPITATPSGTCNQISWKNTGSTIVHLTGLGGRIFTLNGQGLYEHYASQASRLVTGTASTSGATLGSLAATRLSLDSKAYLVPDIYANRVVIYDSLNSRLLNINRLN